MEWQKRLEELLISYKVNEVPVLIDVLLKEGRDVSILRESLLDNAEKFRKKLMSDALSIPEYLLSIDTVFSGLKHLFAGKDFAGNKDKTIVIGVVKGDPHDLGKNIISEIYKVYGYNVIDLGRDTEDDIFLDTVIKNNAQVLALSAMMSTTALGMKAVIDKVKGKKPDTSVIIGGACLSEDLAKDYGADAYCPTVKTVIEETEKLFN